jgi:Bacterial regulatory proteins, luxR family
VPPEETKDAGSEWPHGRELAILQLVAAGSSNREIACALLVPEQTVEFHLSNVRRKLDCEELHPLARAHAGSRSSHFPRPLGAQGKAPAGPRARTVFTLSVAQSLVEDGWVRGDFKRTDASGRTAYCLVGALDESAEGLELGIGASRRAAQTIMRVLGKHCPGFLPRWRLSFWNDRRDKLEVLAVLAKARRLCEEETGQSPLSREAPAIASLTAGLATRS